MAPSKYSSGVIATPIRFRYIALPVRETIPLATTDTRTTRIQLAATAAG